jgi:hypothetical protein
MPAVMSNATQYRQGMERGVRTAEESRELARRLRARSRYGSFASRRAFQLGNARGVRRRMGVGG